MKKFLTTIFVSAALLVSFNSSAQSQWGFGGGFISGSFSGADLILDIKAYPGFYIGIDRNWAFSSLEGLSLDPGVNFVYMSRDKTRLPMIQVPVHLKYSVDLGPDVRGALYTGPTFNFGMVSNGFSKDDVWNEGHRLKRWQAQWGVGAELTFSESIAVKVGYDLGMTRAFAFSGDDPRVRFNCFHIGVVFRVFE